MMRNAGSVPRHARRATDGSRGRSGSDTPARQLRSLVKGHDVHGNRIEVATHALAGRLFDYEMDGRAATAAQAEEAMAWIDGPWTEERFGDHVRIDLARTLSDPPAPGGQ